MFGRADDRQKMIAIAHPEHSLGELEIFRRVFELQSRHEINFKNETNLQK